MYFIKKYADGWAIHDDSNGQSRLLSDNEIELAKEEHPDLKDEKVLTVFFDQLKSFPMETNITKDHK